MLRILWFYNRGIKKILTGSYLFPFNFIDPFNICFFYSAILITIKIAILIFSQGKLSFTPYLYKCSVQTVPKLFHLDEVKCRTSML